VLGLFEGVATGAADGYARMAEKPACTLLHLGPGLGNGLANLHNAHRAHVPIANLWVNILLRACNMTLLSLLTLRAPLGLTPNGCARYGSKISRSRNEEGIG
jgi:hypothetical protein